jgi:hypothetical protein
MKSAEISIPIDNEESPESLLTLHTPQDMLAFEQPMRQLSDQVVPSFPPMVDSRVNRTLSQINEEYDEDDLSALNHYTPNTNRKRSSVGSVSPLTPNTVSQGFSMS